MDKVSIVLIAISCGGIFWSCICRLNMTHKDVLPRVRHRYWLIGTASLIVPFGGFIFPFEYGGMFAIAMFFVANALGFWLDRKDWERGVPPSATEPGGLYAHKSPTPPIH